MNINIMIIAIILLLISKFAMAIWVYKDAKSKNLEPMVWMILVLLFSGILTLLFYLVVARKSKVNQCDKCGFKQPAGIPYCGNCGNRILTTNSIEDTQDFRNRFILVLAIITAILGLILGSIFIVNQIKDDFFQDIPISIMQYESKIGPKWKASFKYRNGEKSHTFKVKDNNTLNCNWDIENGSISAIITYNDIIIEEFNSVDNPNISKSINLDQYAGEKVKIIVKSEKATGSFSFILNNN